MLAPGIARLLHVQVVPARSSFTRSSCPYCGHWYLRFKLSRRDGLHWSFGRLGAEGLRGMCAYVSPESARPGDLIFFEKTYDTAGASHVGIYVGNNRMLHCGDPIHYASIDTSYWRSHFLQFGRLP